MLMAQNIHHILRNMLLSTEDISKTKEKSPKEREIEIT